MTLSPAQRQTFTWTALAALAALALWLLAPVRTPFVVAAVLARALHPLAVVFALVAFGQLFGFMGVLRADRGSALDIG